MKPFVSTGQIRVCCCIAGPSRGRAWLQRMFHHHTWAASSAAGAEIEQLPNCSNKCGLTNCSKMTAVLHRFPSSPLRTAPVTNWWHCYIRYPLGPCKHDSGGIEQLMTLWCESVIQKMWPRPLRTWQVIGWNTVFFFGTVPGTLLMLDGELMENCLGPAYQWLKGCNCVHFVCKCTRPNIPLASSDCTIPSFISHAMTKQFECCGGGAPSTEAWSAYRHINLFLVWPIHLHHLQASPALLSRWMSCSYDFWYVLSTQRSQHPLETVLGINNLSRRHNKQSKAEESRLLRASTKDFRDSANAATDFRADALHCPRSKQRIKQTLVTHWYYRYNNIFNCRLSKSIFVVQSNLQSGQNVMIKSKQLVQPHQRWRDQPLKHDRHQPTSFLSVSH